MSFITHCMLRLGVLHLFLKLGLCWSLCPSRDSCFDTCWENHSMVCRHHIHDCHIDTNSADVPLSCPSVQTAVCSIKKKKNLYCSSSWVVALGAVVVDSKAKEHAEYPAENHYYSNKTNCSNYTKFQIKHIFSGLRTQHYSK